VPLPGIVVTPTAIAATTTIEEPTARDVRRCFNRPAAADTDAAST
jgi:hypothetical protein